MKNLLFFDTETTGLPKQFNAPYTDVENFPRMVQIAWILYRGDQEISSNDFLIKPENYEIPKESSNVHGFTTEQAIKDGFNMEKVLNRFYLDSQAADMIVAHNISFDKRIFASEMVRAGREKQAEQFYNKEMFCTMKTTTKFCELPGKNGGFKWPKLAELYEILFGCEFENAHNALFDIRATAKCYFELKNRGIFE